MCNPKVTSSRCITSSALRKRQSAASSGVRRSATPRSNWYMSVISSYSNCCRRTKNWSTSLSPSCSRSQARLTSSIYSSALTETPQPQITQQQQQHHHRYHRKSLWMEAETMSEPRNDGAANGSVHAGDQSRDEDDELIFFGDEKAVSILAELEKANAMLANRFPGERTERQPVHTVY